MAGTIRRIVLNPRAYIRPFVFLLIFHHLPLLIAYGWITPPNGYELCLPLYFQFDWMRGAFISHLILLFFLFMSLCVTLCSRVYRTHKSEQWIILLIFLLYACNLFWSIYGATSSADTSTCRRDSNEFQDAAYAVKYVQHIDLSISVIVVLFVTSSSYLCGVYTNVHLEPSDKRWQSRCVRMIRFFTCTSLQRTFSPNLLESLGKLLCKFFVVKYKSDVYEGFQFNDLRFCLGLVAEAQRGEYKANTSESTRFPEEEEATRLQDLAYYGRIAGAMYGWPEYVWHAPLESFKLFRSRSQSQQRILEQNDATQASRSSFLAHTGLPSTALIYLNCHNTLSMSPYSIVKDTDRQELVISIRGNLSFYDYITEGLAHTELMTEDELPHDIPKAQHTIAHCGMLRSARAIYQHLQTEACRELFWDFAVGHCQTLNREGGGWKIVVCGHSLGAGVGAILALLLKRVFPQTNAALFAPPMTFDPVTASWTRSFMTTVVYGDDIVPRLSIRTLMRLREEMMTSFNAVASEKLYRVRYAKYLKQKKATPTIEADARAFSVANSIEEQSDGPLESDGPEVAMDLTFHDDSSSQTEAQNVVDIDFIRSPDDDGTVQIDIPGQIVHIQSVNRPRTISCTMILGKQPLTYSLRDASYFRRIWVTSRAIQDHLVHHYDRDIRQLLSCLHIPLEKAKPLEIHVDVSDKKLEGYQQVYTPR